MSGLGFILPLVIAVAATLFVLSFANKMEGKTNIRQRVRRLVQQDVGASDEFDRLDSYKDEQSALAESLDKLLRALKISSEDSSRETQMRFAQAGIRSPNALIYYVFAKKLGWAVGGFIALLLVSGNETGMMQWIVWGIALIVVLAGIFGADMYLKKQERKTTIHPQPLFP